MNEAKTMPVMTRETLPILMTIREAAKYLRCSPVAVYQRCFRRQIPFTKIGSRVYILREDLDRQLRRNRVEPALQARLRATPRPDRGGGR